MVEVSKLRSGLSNEFILDGIRNQASNEYYRRVPSATQAGIQEAVQKMWDHRPTRNEFVDALINRIGLEIFRTNSFTNPLGKFKQGALEWGDTIEEVMVGLLEAKGYDANRDELEAELFGQARPDVQSSFHKINRQDRYKVTVNTPILKRAFLREGGLSSFVAQIMEAPSISDQWDEFLLTARLFREYYDASGYFKIQVPNVSASGSTEADAKAFLRRTREMADKLPFISTHYNAAGMPIAAKRDELELFITPGANAAIDVEALAAAFNEDRANMPMRTTVIPEEHFGITGAQAILTTRDFFVIADSLMETTSLQNPAGLYDNYWLHHHEVIAASRFVPAVLFTTEAGDVIEIADTPVTSVAALTVENRAGTTVTTVERGELYNVAGSAVTTPTGGVNDAVRLELTGNKSQYTYLTVTGALSVGADEDAVSLTVKAYAVSDNTFTNSITVNVTGAKVDVWPNPTVFEDVDNDGLNEVTPIAVPVAPTSGANKNKVTIPEMVGVDYKDGGTTVSGTTITLTGAKTITAVAQAGYEIKTGATASWALVFTA